MFCICLRILFVIDFSGQQLSLTYLGRKRNGTTYLASLANGFALMPHNEMPPKNSGAKISGFYWKTMAPPALVKKEKKIFLLLPQQMFFLCKIRASGRGKTFFLYWFAWRFRITPLGMTSGFSYLYLNSCDFPILCIYKPRQVPFIVR